jgi:hypothetical protein
MLAYYRLWRCAPPPARCQSAPYSRRQRSAHSFQFEFGLAELIRRQYTLGFKAQEDGQYHRIKVTVRDPQQRELKVRTRAGYVAPKSSGGVHNWAGGLRRERRSQRRCAFMIKKYITQRLGYIFMNATMRPSVAGIL